MNFKLAIFDLDGLLVESEKLYEKAFIDAARVLGYNATKEQYARTLGLGAARANVLCKEMYGRDFPVEKFNLLLRKYILDDMEKNGMPLRPGVKTLLDRLDKRGIKCAVASSNDRDLAELLLERAGIKNRFAAVNTAADVKHTKPAPDLFLKTAADFNMPRENCIIFEDAENGVLAAEAAGIKVCLVPDIIMPPPAVLAKAYKVYKTINAALELF